MGAFDCLLNWKLTRGSHYFPGPGGGTCINEVAIIAAGFEYQPVVSAEGMPGCFSRPICALAMALNDYSTDEERQRLLPYVTRLACADTPEIERQRADYIEQRLPGLMYRVPFKEGLSVLEGALAIGRQANPLGPDEVRPRMEAARTTMNGPKKAETDGSPSSASDKPRLSKVKSWLTMKKMEPMA